MRINLPVSQRNRDYPAHQTLISVTDTKGRITYCNTDFIKISGYSEEELLGQPHNLIRHPDVPAEAFRDLWATVESGKLWSAVVKNRCKNGDHYWVRANVTPMRDGDRIIGYLSVRTRPSNAEIQAAEKLFATMSAEAAAGRLVHGLRHATPVRRDAIGRALQWLHLGQKGKTRGLVALAAAGPLLAAQAGASTPLLWGAGVLSAGLAGFGLARLAQPLDEVVHTARRLASGDLSRFVSVQGRGIARSLLLPIAQLALGARTVLTDLRSDLGEVQTAARDVARGSMDLAARTETQAASLQRTASAMEQISGTVQQTSELASDGVRIARESSGSTERSQEAIRGMAATMQEITESSRRIGDITQVIESVAFQTNILALNAAVEAARAGEQGRGFAVVAAEVRALAQRTTGLAKEIGAQIAESQQRVAAGGARAEQARQRMDEAVASVQQVSRVLEQIDHAAREQALGVRQVGESAQELDGITQQNAALVEQLAAAASQMEAQTQHAARNIQVFRLTPGDRTHAEVDAVALRRQARHAAGASSPAKDDGRAPPQRAGQRAAQGAPTQDEIVAA
jgi:aerotaxis receptor